MFEKLGSNFLLKDKNLALQLDKRYFGFTPEYKQQIASLEPDKERIAMLQKAGVVPDDPSWLRG